MTVTRRHHAALPPGHVLHWYRVESILGQGGFGITYLATDTNLQQKVAIKEYLPTDLAVRIEDSKVEPMSSEHEHTFSWGLARFIAEAQTLAKFHHANIVPVRNVFEANNTAYMVMSHIDGDTLVYRLKFGQQFTEDKLRSLLDALLDGLDIVHQAGFIHRDIKPDNILIQTDGTPVLIDFGSAREALAGETQALTAVVTPGYAPYEQYDSSSSGDRQGPWTDIYALGAVMYRAVTGRTPVDSTARVNAVLQNEEILVPASELAADRYSIGFLQAIDRAMQFDPRHRPQSVAAWRKMLDGESTSNLDAKTAVVTGHQDPASIKRSPKTMWIVGVCVVAIVGVVLVNINYEEMLDQKKSTAVSPAQNDPTSVAEERLAEAEAQQLLEQEQQRLADAEAQRLLEQEQQRLAEAEAQQLLEQEQQQLADAEAQRLLEQEQQRLADAEAQRLLEQEQQQLADAEAQRLLEQEQQRLADAEAQRLLEQEQLRLAEAETQQSEIETLLNAASEDISQLRLTSPKDDNALHKLTRVLALSPNHPRALAGLNSIVNRYVELAENRIADDKFNEAQAYLAKADSVIPETETVRKSRRRLNTLRETTTTIEEQQSPIEESPELTQETLSKSEQPETRSSELDGDWKGRMRLYGTGYCPNSNLFVKIVSDKAVFESISTDGESMTGSASIAKDGSINGQITLIVDDAARETGVIKGQYSESRFEGAVSGKFCNGEWWLARP